MMVDIMGNFSKYIVGHGQRLAIHLDKKLEDAWIIDTLYYFLD